MNRMNSKKCCVRSDIADLNCQFESIFADKGNNIFSSSYTITGNKEYCAFHSSDGSKKNLEILLRDAISYMLSYQSKTDQVTLDFNYCIFNISQLQFNCHSSRIPDSANTIIHIRFTNAVFIGNTEITLPADINKQFSNKIVFEKTDFSCEVKISGVSSRSELYIQSCTGTLNSLIVDGPFSNTSITDCHNFIIEKFSYKAQDSNRFAEHALTIKSISKIADIYLEKFPSKEMKILINPGTPYNLNIFSPLPGAKTRFPFLYITSDVANINNYPAVCILPQAIYFKNIACTELTIKDLKDSNFSFIASNSSFKNFIVSNSIIHNRVETEISNININNNSIVNGLKIFEVSNVIVNDSKFNEDVTLNFSDGAEYESINSVYKKRLNVYGTLNKLFINNTNQFINFIPNISNIPTLFKLPLHRRKSYKNVTHTPENEKYARYLYNKLLKMKEATQAGFYFSLAERYKNWVYGNRIAKIYSYLSDSGYSIYKPLVLYILAILGIWIFSSNLPSLDCNTLYNQIFFLNFINPISILKSINFSHHITLLIFTLLLSAAQGLSMFLLGIAIRWRCRKE